MEHVELDTEPAERWPWLWCILNVGALSAVGWVLVYAVIMALAGALP